jgi:AcrR family transcriptional regulator
MVYHQMVDPESAGVNAVGERTRPPGRRSYQKSKRAELERRTRARIVDAAEHLHGTIGPARTTLSAIAERAEVTRATLYRHFDDEESLFLACSSQWLSRQHLPDPDSWAPAEHPDDRLRAGLADIYRYYREAEPMLANVLRDVDAVPSRVVAARRSNEQRWLDALLEGRPGRRRKVVRAAVAHAIAFTTWQSLCKAQGLADRSAVELMVGMVHRAGEGAATRARR